MCEETMKFFERRVAENNQGRELRSGKSIAMRLFEKRLAGIAGGLKL